MYPHLSSIGDPALRAGGQVGAAGGADQVLVRAGVDGLGAGGEAHRALQLLQLGGDPTLQLLELYHVFHLPIGEYKGIHGAVDYMGFSCYWVEAVQNWKLRSWLA